MDGTIASDTSGGVNPVLGFLSHYGVKGMKWGVRKSDGGSGKTPLVKPTPKLVLKKEFKSGDSVSIYENPPNRFVQLMARKFPNYKDAMENSAYFTLKDKDGKKVGNASFYRRGKDSLYLDWIGIKQNHRGKGYASAALDGVVKYARSEGIKELTLDVPGNAPDAKHIYTKLGFKESGPINKVPNDPWGGLQPMSLKVNEAKHADEPDPEKWAADFSDEFAQFLKEYFDNRGEEVEHMSAVDDFLAHYGVKGMRWGVRRKAKGPSSAEAERKAAVKTQAKKEGVRTLSNKDLQDAITRMNLEQQFKRLSVNEKPVVSRFIASTLLEIGKREVQTAVAKKVAGAVARKAVTGGVG